MKLKKLKKKTKSNKLFAAIVKNILFGRTY